MKGGGLTLNTLDVNNLIEVIDFLRIEASQKLSAPARAKKGQYFTPQKTAGFMAKMFTGRPKRLRILDAGAGIGSLSAALIMESLQWGDLPPKYVPLLMLVQPAEIG